MYIFMKITLKPLKRNSKHKNHENIHIFNKNHMFLYDLWGGSGGLVARLVPTNHKKTYVFLLKILKFSSKYTNFRAFRCAKPNFCKKALKSHKNPCFGPSASRPEGGPAAGQGPAEGWPLLLRLKFR